MKKNISLIVLIIFNLFLINQLFAQNKLKVALVKGKLALIKTPTNTQFQKDQEFIIFRNDNGEEIQIAKAKVKLIKEKVCGVKILESYSDNGVQKGDYILIEEDLESILSNFNSDDPEISGTASNMQFLNSFKQGFALTGAVSSLGFGIEFTKRITPAWNIRFGMNRFDYVETGIDSSSGIDYEADFKLNSLSFLIDWYPFSNGFRFGSGLIINNNTVKLTMKPLRTYQFGSTIYTPDEAGTLTGKLFFDKLAPYIGLGWGNAVSPQKRFGFMVDFGVIYQNSPHVDFEADGLIAPSADQDVIVEEDLKGWKAFGIFTVGLTIRLF